MAIDENEPVAVAIRHVEFEDLGTIETAFHELGYKFRYVDAPVEPIDLTAGLSCDLLVVLGGPIGAYEEQQYPFLTNELRLIEQRLKAGRAVLGVCLGAQLMARALGARVYPGPQKEIGWSALSLTQEGLLSSLRNLDGMSVLHWHCDTFDLPVGATRLASTNLYENQAFSWGTSALGLQFHAEALGPPLERWFVGHACEIAAVPGVSVNQLRADSQRLAPALSPCAIMLWREWLQAATTNRVRSGGHES